MPDKMKIFFMLSIEENTYRIHDSTHNNKKQKPERRMNKKWNKDNGYPSHD